MNSSDVGELKSIEFSFSEEELKEFVVRLCQMGEAQEKTPAQFAIMLSIAAKHLCDAQDIQFRVEKRHDA